CGVDIQLDHNMAAAAAAATTASEAGTLYLIGHLHVPGIPAGLQGHGPVQQQQQQQQQQSTTRSATVDPLTVYTRSCPLQVTARPGQTVNITLYSFNRGVFVGGGGGLHQYHMQLQFPSAVLSAAAAAA